jgi:hypothetical protein
LACGPGAALSHQQAAELLKLAPAKGGPIEVSARRVRDHAHRRRPPHAALQPRAGQDEPEYVRATLAKVARRLPDH